MKSISAFTAFPDCTDPVKAIEGFIHPPYKMTPQTHCHLIQQKMMACRIYFSCAIIVTIFMVSTTGLLIYRTTRKPDVAIDLSILHFQEEQRELPHKWRSYSLQRRGLFITVLGAFGNLVFIDTILFYQMSINIVNCDILLWGVLVGYYTWIFSVCAQTHRLRKLLRLNKLIVRYMSLTEAEQARHKDEADYRWMMSQGSKRAFSNVCSGIIYVFTIAVVVATCAIGQAISFYKDGHRCYYQWGICLCIGLSASFLVLVAPYIAWSLRCEKDAHGIRRELLLEVGIGIPCFIAYIVWTFVYLPKSFFYGMFTYLLFSSVNWIMVFVFICHFISVVLPLVNDLWQPFDTLGSWHFWNSKRFRKRKPRFHIKLNRVFGIINPRALTNRHSLDMTPSSLEFVFGNPDLLGRLKQLAIQDFSAENVLFYEKYRHLCGQVKLCQCRPHRRRSLSFLSHPSTLATKEDIPDSESLLLDRPIDRDLWPGFIDFYQTYIRQGAPLEVNISYQARHQIDTVFKHYSKGESWVNPWTVDSSRDAQKSNTSIGSQSSGPDIEEGLCLGVFETARKEVFWNIFASIYPKLVESTENG